MLTFDGHCPHCHSDKGFNAFGISCYIIGDRDYEAFPLTDQEVILNDAYELTGGSVANNVTTQAVFSLAGECRKCHQPIVATCHALRSHFKEYCECLNEEKRTMCFEGRVDAIHPQPVPPYAHHSLPDNVREAFIDLQKMLTENKQPHFIITGCRTVLEAAVRELGGGQEGDKLYARIDDLFAKGVITATLKDWASIIRKSGNGAAHEMRGTPEEAREFVDFTKIFLQFTFELPATIRALKS